MNLTEYRELTAKKAKKPKYLNVKTDGYDSKKEAQRAGELKLLQKAGVISELREQVKFELIPCQRDKWGRVVERAVNWVADFVYTEKGIEVWEDCKGFKTPSYILKRKLALERYGKKIKET